MAPRYRVTLLESERFELEALTRNGKTGAKKFINARVLLLCDAGPHGPAWTVAKVAEAVGVTSRTEVVPTIRTDFSSFLACLFPHHAAFTKPC